ncbi:MAG: PilZ domain-containing protein [Candidatus Omnitrophica bacterium]|nr:PilZ domain-containing protein [Candidatus Omnitrophota bacterium]
MEQPEIVDRRLFHRIKADLSVKFLDLNSQKQGRAKTCDLSGNGIGLITEENLLPQTPLEIWFDLPGKTDPLYTKGEVVWSKMVNDQHYRVGVRLEKPEFICFAPILRYLRKGVSS